MAARLNKMHSEQVRAKIQASVIIDRLHRHVSGELEMTSSQINAASILLGKTVDRARNVKSWQQKDL